jgi:SlyX protein
MKMEERVEALEVHVMHLMRAVEELSDLSHQQADEIKRLNRRLELMLEREAQRQHDSSEPLPPDQKPPHY